MAAGRIPDYFDLERYGIGAADVARQVLGCDPARIRPLVVLAPTWSAQVLSDHTDRCEPVVDGFVKVDDVTSGGLSFSYIRSGVGAPQAGDVALALGCTACSRILFIGSAGGLSEKEQVGDVVVPTHSIGGDGFSGYLARSAAGPAAPPEPEARPDAGFQALVAAKASEACAASGVAIHAGPVYSIDTIVAQFQHLPWMIDRFGCIGIEMETAAVFRAARLVGIRAAALLQLSDVIAARKSLFSGRTQAERSRYREVRRTVLGGAVVAALRDAAGAVG
jgi:nucleoside phosphorylase